MLNVEVIYIDEHKNIFQKNIELPDNSCAKDALTLSGLYEAYPCCRDRALGIFGKKIAVNARLKNGDRLEVYRPLTIDPMKKRRLRAQASLQK